MSPAANAAYAKRLNLTSEGSGPGQQRLHVHVQVLVHAPVPVLVLVLVQVLVLVLVQALVRCGAVRTSASRSLRARVPASQVHDDDAHHDDLHHDRDAGVRGGDRPGVQGLRLQRRGLGALREGTEAHRRARVDEARGGTIASGLATQRGVEDCHRVPFEVFVEKRVPEQVR